MAGPLEPPISISNAGESKIHGAATYDARLRTVEQVPYCGDCENPIGRTHSRNVVRLRFVGYPYWEQGCALGGCADYYRTTRHCWLWGIEKACN